MALPAPANAYSATWVALFLQTVDPGQTAAEVASLARWLPLPTYRQVLDLCCGLGRHAAALAARGYAVTGVDRAGALLAQARRAAPAGVVYREGDIRDLAAIPGAFDAVANLWQSFGYFDPATNAAVMRGIAAKLRPGGRLVLDIYHRDFFAHHLDARQGERAGRHFVERKTLIGDRLTVHLDYGPGTPADTFAWQLYTPEEITALAAQAGLGCLLACTGFDESTPPSPDSPRMQLVFEKPVTATSSR